MSSSREEIITASSSSSSSPPPTTPTTTANKEERMLEEQVIQLNNRVLYERQLRVAEAARKVFEEDNGQFKIRLKIPTGKTIINAFGDEELEFKEDVYHTETYHYNKLSATDNNTLLLKRAELGNEQDPQKSADLTNRIYEFLALKFLKIKRDDYTRAVWDDVRLAVDVCNHINEWAHKEIEIIPREKQARLIKVRDRDKENNNNNNNNTSPNLDPTTFTMSAK
jgi:hypothetical protein